MGCSVRSHSTAVTTSATAQTRLQTLSLPQQLASRRIAIDLHNRCVSSDCGPQSFTNQAIRFCWVHPPLGIAFTSSIAHYAVRVRVWRHDHTSQTVRSRSIQNSSTVFVVDCAAHAPASGAKHLHVAYQFTAALHAHACGVLLRSGPGHPQLALSLPLTRALVCCCLSSSASQEFVVDVSLDLMQYISESFNDMLVPSSATCQHGAVQSHKGQGPSTGLDTCPSLMGSSCSTHSNQVVPDSPTCRQSQQQDAPASSRSSDCSMRGSCEPDAPAGPSSSRSSSSAGMDLERTDSLPQARSSSLAYDDDFVFQCYYGDPNSPANQQQQRVKKLSPFAAFSTFPGFGY